MKKYVIAGILAFSINQSANAAEVCYGKKCEYKPHTYSTESFDSKSGRTLMDPIPQIHINLKSGFKISFACPGRGLVWVIAKTTKAGRRNEYDRGENSYSSSKDCYSEIDSIEAQVKAGKEITLKADKNGLSGSGSEGALFGQAVRREIYMQRDTEKKAAQPNLETEAEDGPAPFSRSSTPVSAPDHSAGSHSPSSGTAVLED